MTFQDDINRMFAEGGIYEHGVTDYLEREHPALFETPAITVHRSSAWLPVSLEQLVDSGAIPEADARAQGWTPYVPPPAPPVSRWTRLRWRWSAWRERTGRKIGGWLAGVDLSERDEEW